MKKVKPKKTKKVKKTVKPGSSRAVKPKAKKKVKKVAKKVVKKVKKAKKIAGPKAKVKRVSRKVTKKVTKPIPALLPAPKRVYTPEEMVEESKYFEPVEVRYPPKEKIPGEYREDKIVVMARDPDWAFTYWEVTSETLKSARERAGHEGNLTLRVYDITGIDFDGKNALSSFDVGVYGRIGSWYIELRRPDHTYCVDLGVLTPQGSFITIVRSNVITTPRDRVSEITDERFMMMEEEFQKIFALSGGYGFGLSSPELREIIKKRFAAGISSLKK